jgi:hypothetical protein
MNNAVQVMPEPEPQRPTNITAMNDSAAMMAVISRAATDPNCDVEKMERLYAMHERMQDRQAAEAFAASMSQAQAEAKKAAKDRNNAQTKSDYATLESIDAAIRPAYTAHGFSLSFDTDESPLANHVRIVCHVMHSAGHTKVYRYDNPMDDKGIAGSVNKTPTHARGSAVTYGRRYLTLLIFNLSTGHHDDDGNGADVEPEPDYIDWKAAIDGESTVEGLKGVKKELEKTFGNKIPAALVQRCVDRMATIKAGAK